jgi:hypothetical protein
VSVPSRPTSDAARCQLYRQHALLGIEEGVLAHWTSYVLLPDDVAVIQAADQGRVVRGKARVARLAHVGIHVSVLEKRAVVESDCLAPDPARTDAVEAREEAGAASLERGDGIGLELRNRVG